MINVLVATLSNDTDAFKSYSIALNKALNPSIQIKEKEQMAVISEALDIMEDIKF